MCFLSVFQLTVRNDLSEVIASTSPDAPIRAVVGTLSHFPNKAAVYHWHSELEFIIVLEGEMHYFVNDTVAKFVCHAEADRTHMLRLSTEKQFSNSTITT